ncbi:MAG: Coenzyme F420 hydrogenase/dehydrogenase, beta subunit C-terminal domain, partial [Oscillospiraceae bacterium]
WEKYKSFISSNNTLKISEISFRNKSSGWKNYSFCATFDNGEVLCETNSQNAYLKAFTKVLLNRKSCESCKSKDFKISSDITLGDYWGIESSFKNVIIDNKGYSMVLVNSVKGSYLFNSIKDNLDVMQSDIEDVIIKQPTLTRSAVSSENRDKFFKQVNNSKNIQKLLLKYGKLSFKEFSKKGIRYINKRILKKKGND